MAEQQKSNSLWFIVGGIVVAILVIFWLMSGGDSVETAGAGGDTAVTVETEAPAEPVADAAADAMAEPTADPAAEPATDAVEAEQPASN